MAACGIQISHPNAKVSYEEFLKLNSFLRYNNGTTDDYIWFCVRLFDPIMSGFTLQSDCENVIDLLFDNQDETGKTTKAPPVKLPPKQGGIRTAATE